MKVRHCLMGFVLASLLPLSNHAQAQTSSSETSEGSSAGDNVANRANNPLTPTVMLSVHDYYIPSLSGIHDRDANQTLLRGLMPHLTGGLPQLFRVTVPISHVPQFPYGNTTAVGDTTFMDLFMFPGEGVSFGVGPVLVAPTAGNDSTGSGKWQAGAAGVAVYAGSWGLIGNLTIYQQSFAGKANREDAMSLTNQPIIFFNLPDDFYLRSSGIWSFNLRNGDYYIPVGLGVGKIWPVAEKVKLNAFVEPQYTVAYKGIGAPRWQIYCGFNVQISVM